MFRARVQYGLAHPQIAVALDLPEILLGHQQGSGCPAPHQSPISPAEILRVRRRTPLWGFWMLGRAPAESQRERPPQPIHRAISSNPSRRLAAASDVPASSRWHLFLQPRLRPTDAAPLPRWHGPARQAVHLRRAWMARSVAPSAAAARPLRVRNGPTPGCRSVDRVIGSCHGGSLSLEGIRSPILCEAGLRTPAQPPTKCRTPSRDRTSWR